MKPICHQHKNQRTKIQTKKQIKAENGKLWGGGGDLENRENKKPKKKKTVRKTRSKQFRTFISNETLYICHLQRSETHISAFTEVNTINQQYPPVEPAGS